MGIEKKPRSILMVSRILDSKDPVGSYTQRWAESLAGKVDYLYFICLEAYDVTVRADNFEYYSMGKEKGYGRLRLLINYYYYLFRIMGKVDGFFGHMNSLYTILAAPIAKIFGVKIISWVTYIDVNFMIRLNTFLSDIMVTASEESLGIDTKKKVALGHGIDIKLFKRDKKKKREKKIVTLGRISRVKNYEIIIEAFNEVADILRKGGWSLDIYGSTPNPDNKVYADEIRKLIRDQSLDDLIHIHPPVPYSEVKGILNTSSIFLHAQPSTVIDKAPLEAMATETVTIMYNPAYRDLLGDELSGLLLFKKNDPDDLAEKIVNIINMDAKKTDEIGRWLRDIVLKNHNVDILMDRLVSLFEIEKT